MSSGVAQARIRRPVRPTSPASLQTEEVASIQPNHTLGQITS